MSGKEALLDSTNLCHSTACDVESCGLAICSRLPCYHLLGTMEKMAVVGGLLQELNSINQMMDSFIAAETEGLIICDQCYDTVFDDDENICTAEDEEGNVRVFCCAQCREEWKQQKRNKS